MQSKPASATTDASDAGARNQAMPGAVGGGNSILRRPQPIRSSGVKLPAFTGKEQWKVWINRFTAVSDRNRWNESERLDELLPRLRGAAGDFVFSQLPGHVLNDYTELIKELNNRYRVIATSKTYGAQFSKRNQKFGETVE